MPRNPDIYIRVDAGPSIGWGHFIRCIALAEYIEPFFNPVFISKSLPAELIKTLEEHGFQHELIGDISLEEDLHLLLSKVSKDNIVVLDGYHFSEWYRNEFGSQRKLIVIDDLHEGLYNCDIVINHSPAAKIENYSGVTRTKFLLGSEYALLRKPFIEAAKNRSFEVENKGVFISLGGSEPAIELSKKICAFLNRFEVELVLGNKKDLVNFVGTNVTIHAGLTSKEICNLMKKAAIVITPASGLSIEAISVGCGLISGYTADNQIENCNAIVKKGCCVSLGNLWDLSEDKLIHAIEKLQNKEFYAELLQNQSRMIDGNSGERIGAEIRRLG